MLGGKAMKPNQSLSGYLSFPSLSKPNLSFIVEEASAQPEVPSAAEGEALHVEGEQNGVAPNRNWQTPYVAEPPKLLGPHAPVLISKTSYGYACAPDNLTGSVRLPQGHQINHLQPGPQD